MYPVDGSIGASGAYAEALSDSGTEGAYFEDDGRLSDTADEVLYLLLGGRTRPGYSISGVTGPEGVYVLGGCMLALRDAG